MVETLKKLEETKSDSKFLFFDIAANLASNTGFMYIVPNFNRPFLLWQIPRKKGT